MALATTIEGYAKILVDYKNQYKKLKDAGKPQIDLDNVFREAQCLRVEASLEGFDLIEIEKKAAELLGHTMTEADWAIQTVFIEQAIVAKRLAAYKLEYSKATTQADRDKAHQNAQGTRALAIQKGWWDDRLDIEEWAYTILGKKSGNTEPFSKYREEVKAYWEAARGVKPVGNETIIDPSLILPSTNSTGTNTGGGGSLADGTRKRFEFGWYDKFGETFSGTDMVVFLAFPGHKPLELGTASTISYNTYREKKQVRTLGRISAKGITKGPRTISGRIILTILNEHIVESLRKEIPYLQGIKHIMMDELPPFDILITFANEYGGAAGLAIQGVTTVDEQKTLSIEEFFTENIFTYLARRLEPMRNMGSHFYDEPYDPLEWFTTTFRSADSEVIGTFKIAETILHEDTLQLTDPNPFYGYDVLPLSEEEIQDMYGNLIGDESNPIVIDGNGSEPIDGYTDPTHEYTHSENRLFFVQIFDKNGNLLKSFDNTVSIRIPNDDTYTSNVKTYRHEEFSLNLHSNLEPNNESTIQYSSSTVLSALKADGKGKLAAGRDSSNEATYTGVKFEPHLASKGEVITFCLYPKGESANGTCVDITITGQQIYYVPLIYPGTPEEQKEKQQELVSMTILREGNDSSIGNFGNYNSFSKQPDIGNKDFDGDYLSATAISNLKKMDSLYFVKSKAGAFIKCKVRLTNLYGGVLKDHVVFFRWSMYKKDDHTDESGLRVDWSRWNRKWVQQKTGSTAEWFQVKTNASGIAEVHLGTYNQNKITDSFFYWYNKDGEACSFNTENLTYSKSFPTNIIIVVEARVAGTNGNFSAEHLARWIILSRK